MRMRTILRRLEKRTAATWISDGRSESRVSSVKAGDI